jgi:predicted dehydrogenase
MHLLIVGSGSVGKRHARNFGRLGCEISCVDPRLERMAELSGEVGVVQNFSSLEDALESGGFDAVAVCSPPHVHVAQTRACLQAGLPVLLEKPLSPVLQEAAQLRDLQQRTRIPVLLGYTWRWQTQLRKVRDLLSQNDIGALRHVRFVMSAHLADWHPWERYQDFFMARRDLGGGALLDESHWTDLAQWMFGLPEAVAARVEKISGLEIDSDDNVDMFLSYANGLRVYLHLDLYGRPHEKTITFVGENGTIRWSVDPNYLSIGRQSSGFDSMEKYSGERNEMFMAVAEEFLQVVAGASPSCTLDDGVNVLRIIEAARASSQQNRTVGLSEIAV